MGESFSKRPTGTRRGRMGRAALAVALMIAVAVALVGLGAGPASAATSPAQVVHEWPSPVQAGDIALGPDGNMWLVATQYENGVFRTGLGKITPAGVITPYLDIWGTHCSDYHCQPNSLHFVGDHLYVSEDYEGRIWDFSVASGSPVAVAEVKSPGTHTPRQIADTGGYLYVTNYDGVNYFPANLSSGNSCFYKAWTYNTNGIAVGPDGNIWAADLKDIVKVTPCTSGQAEPTVYSAGLSAGANVTDIVSAGGSLWFTDSLSGSSADPQVHDAIGRVTTSGEITEYPVPTAQLPNQLGILGSMAVASDGSVWFTEGRVGQVGRFSPSDPSQITEYAMPSGTWVNHLASGPDGNMWYTGTASDGSPVVGEIALQVNVAPTASFTVRPGAATTPTSFDAAASTDPDGTIASYTWDFGDGHFATTAAPTTTHVYEAAGTYRVTLTVTDNQGSSTSVAHGATVPPPPPAGGYWVVNGNGDVYGFGGVPAVSSLGVHLNAPIVGMAVTPTGNGYWLVGADGGVFAVGDAAFHGSLGGLHLNAPIVGIAATKTGNGYWLVGADGGVFAVGDAAFHGSLAGLHLNAPIVGIVPTSDDGGYWLFGADGAVFAVGDAAFHGSLAGLHLNAPIVAMVPTSTGLGYWLVGADGAVFAIGDAGFHGSLGGLHLSAPIVGMAVTADELGYWLVGADGGVYALGSAPWLGRPPAGASIVGMARSSTTLPLALPGAVSSASGISTDPGGTATATNAGTTVTASGAGAFTVAQYASNPAGALTFASTGQFFDVHVAAGSSFTSLTIKDCNLNGGGNLYWWNGVDWLAVSPQSYAGGPPACVTATLGSSSSPAIAQLTGTVFAVAKPTTPPPPRAKPTVSTGGVSAITASSAGLHATVNPQGQATTYHLDYGTSTAYGSKSPLSDPELGADSTDHQVSQAVSGLQPSKTYHYRIVASNTTGTSYGTDRTFKTAPRITALRLSPARFRALRSGPSVLLKGSKGTKVSYKLWERGSTTFTVEQVNAGRRKGKSCVPDTRDRRKLPRCNRYVVLKGSFKHTGKTGQNSFRFTGRLGGKTLKPGTYRLTAIVRDSTGKHSAPIRITFTIRR